MRRNVYHVTPESFYAWYAWSKASFLPWTLEQSVNDHQDQFSQWILLRTFPALKLHIGGHAVCSPSTPATGWYLLLLGCLGSNCPSIQRASPSQHRIIGSPQALHTSRAIMQKVITVSLVPSPISHPAPPESTSIPLFRAISRQLHPSWKPILHVCHHQTSLQLQFPHNLLFKKSLRRSKSLWSMQASLLLNWQQRIVFCWADYQRGWIKWIT